MISKATRAFLPMAALILCGCGAGGSHTGPAEVTGPAPLIPLEDFFRNPDRVGYRLSPDGEHIAFLMPWESRLNVHVQRIGADEAVRVTSATERDIAAFAWANNRRLVYVQDSGGDENFHLYAVDVDGANATELTPFEGVKVEIVDDLEDNDDEMLIAMNRRDPRLFDVYRIDINSGESELIASNPGNIEEWITDNAGRLRVAQATDGVNTTLLYRPTEDEDFQPVQTISFKDTLNPIFFTFDDQHLYVTSNLSSDREAIYRYDPATGEHLELVYEHPEVDVDALLRSKARQTITGVAFVTDKLEYHFFDEQTKEIFDRLRAELPDTEIHITSRSRDETKLLVVTTDDTSQGIYYFYDTTTGTLTKLVDVSPWLDPDQLAQVQPVQYTARDGLTIHGYLTLPRGSDGTDLPVVVLVHGGPWARDVWGFNPEVQFLANRGYAVLQMNFRGSTGYGKAFWQASFKEWGRAMQDDITDGVKWLIDEGIADPARIGIYGASYGGYAALAGLAFTPDLYACGVSYVGISNLFTLLDTLPPYWELQRRMMYEMIGDPETEEELLRAASPLFHADQIDDPLLVIQGANDPRVKKAESDQIVEALAARGIDVPYLVKDNEGHGFMNEENRFEAYRMIERFFADHLGGRAEEVTEG
jgi:dipeptidyl aminopeptidase/acylaminoacyl peptidase